MGKSIGQRLRAYAEREGRGYPDWALRYMPIADRLAPYHHDGDTTIEIGANACGYQRFSNARVIAVDYEWDHLQAAREGGAAHAVRADIAHLPFADDAADVIVCADTFEHLPPDMRSIAAQEIGRVLSPRGAAAITFPSGDAAADAEAQVQAEYETHTGRRLGWWDEHAEHGLPDPAQLQDHFGATHITHVIAINAIATWQWAWRVLLCDWPGRGNALAQVALYWLTPWLATKHEGPCYRAAIFLEPRHDA